MNIDDLPVKIMHEPIVCQVEVPVRCRRRARVYMDGVGYCDLPAHLAKIDMVQFAKRIEYRK